MHTLIALRYAAILAHPQLLFRRGAEKSSNDISREPVGDVHATEDGSSVLLGRDVPCIGELPRLEPVQS